MTSSDEFFATKVILFNAPSARSRLSGSNSKHLLKYWRELIRSHFPSGIVSFTPGGRFHVRVVHYTWSKARDDLDNKLKPILDALSNWVFEDDKYVDRIEYERCPILSLDAQTAIRKAIASKLLTIESEHDMSPPLEPSQIEREILNDISGNTTDCILKDVVFITFGTLFPPRTLDWLSPHYAAAKDWESLMPSFSPGTVGKAKGLYKYSAWHDAL